MTNVKTAGAKIDAAKKMVGRYKELLTGSKAGKMSRTAEGFRKRTQHGTSDTAKNLAGQALGKKKKELAVESGKVLKTRVATGAGAAALAGGGGYGAYKMNKKAGKNTELAKGWLRAMREKAKAGAKKGAEAAKSRAEATADAITGSKGARAAAFRGAAMGAAAGAGAGGGGAYLAMRKKSSDKTAGAKVDAVKGALGRYKELLTGSKAGKMGRTAEGFRKRTQHGTSDTAKNLAGQALGKKKKELAVESGKVLKTRVATGAGAGAVAGGAGYAAMRKKSSDMTIAEKIAAELA